MSAPEPAPDRAQERDLPTHVVTPLLTLITERSLDEDYAQVARQRSTGERPPRTSRSGLVASLLVVALFGMLVAVAAVQNQRNSEAEALSRSALISQIEDTRAGLRDAQERLSQLSTDTRVATERSNELRSRQRELDDLTERLAVLSGYTAVQGPGVRITVDSSPSADATTEVRDEDLATLVDGLWQAGAEAIALNGERLTPLTGIRNTGRAVHVGGNPLTPPYTVDAIGDPGSLQSRLLDTSQGAAWFVLVRSLGFEFSATNMEQLRLPAANLRPLRQVEVLQGNEASKIEDEEVGP